MKPIYLDNAASTKISPKVLKAMLPYFKDKYGNPSSTHEMGEKVFNAINKARSNLAEEINAKPWEIYFTSGGTESNNLAIQGLARANPKKKTIIISSIEHPSVVEVCNYLQSQDYRIIKIPVDKEGMILINELENQLKKNSKDTLLVSIMHANNIIGTIQPIEEISKLCSLFKTPFHTDAVQTFGKLDIDLKKRSIDLLSASAHKINGPKGVGFLYVRDGTSIRPLHFGGQQERGLRSGTENVPAIIGFAKAAELVKQTNKKKIEKIRGSLISELEKIGGIVNGSKHKRLFNNINIRFSGIEADLLVAFLSKNKIYISVGSACESKKQTEDYVLKSLDLNKQEISSSVRITLSETITDADISRIVKEISNFLKKLKTAK